MKIIVSCGRGSGPTPLGAFDAALIDAGISDYNLILLSSVIPPGSTVERQRPDPQTFEYGHRLYLVMAQQRVEELGEEAWAGLGWTQNQETGHGLFVELHGHSRHEVERAVHATLEEMIANRKRIYGPIHTEVCGTECTGRPACALVVATYQSEGWA